MGKTRKYNANELNLKAMGKARREMEISMYGHSIHTCKVEKSKKEYSRKPKYKTDYSYEDE